MKRAMDDRSRTGARVAAIVGWLFAAVVLSGCTESAVWPELEPPPIPEQRPDGWRVGALADHGFDPQPIALLDHEIRTGRIEEIDALLIARHGVLVYEGYFHPATGPDALHQLNSVTKSVMSMAVGVAKQQGLIESYDQAIADFFPEHGDIFEREPEKKALTLRHVLTMTAGLEWDDRHPSDREQDGHYIRQVPDVARYILEKPLVEDPGVGFRYSAACPALLAAMVRNVAGEEADAFAGRELFGPLGIDTVIWKRYADGTTDADGGLFMRGRDLARLGQLYLEDGRWEGRQVVPGEWIEASFRPWTDSDWRTSRYGFQWWLYPYSANGDPGEYGLIAGSGYGGQKLLLIPELDLVAVYFGCTTEGYVCGNSDTVPETTLYNYILRAIRDS